MRSGRSSPAAIPGPGADRAVRVQPLTATRTAPPRSRPTPVGVALPGCRTGTPWLCPRSGSPISNHRPPVYETPPHNAQHPGRSGQARTLFTQALGRGQGKLTRPQHQSAESGAADCTGPPWGAQASTRVDPINAVDDRKDTDSRPAMRTRDTQGSGTNQRARLLAHTTSGVDCFQYYSPPGGSYTRTGPPRVVTVVVSNLPRTVRRPRVQSPCWQSQGSTAC